MRSLAFRSYRNKAIGRGISRYIEKKFGRNLGFSTPTIKQCNAEVDTEISRNDMGKKVQRTIMRENNGTGKSQESVLEEMKI